MTSLSPSGGMHLRDCHPPVSRRARRSDGGTLRRIAGPTMFVAAVAAAGRWHPLIYPLLLCFAVMWLATPSWRRTR